MGRDSSAPAGGPPPPPRPPPPPPPRGGGERDGAPRRSPPRSPSGPAPLTPPAPPFPPPRAGALTRSLRLAPSPASGRGYKRHGLPRVSTHGSPLIHA